MDIHEQIKEVRKAKGLSQQDMADKMEINRVQYNRIETGKSEVTISNLKRIAKALDIDIVDFFRKDVSFDINSSDKTLIEKIKLLEQLDDSIKTSIYTFIDTAIANKKFRDNLSSLLAS